MSDPRMFKFRRKRTKYAVVLLCTAFEFVLTRAKQNG